MTTTSAAGTDLAAERADWLQWREQRHRLATAPHGLASVTGTHWLDDTPQRILGLPGSWTALGGFEGEREFGQLRLRTVRRDGRTALRVFDPTAVDVIGVDAFEFDSRWRIDGVFTAADDGALVQTTHVDGRVGDSALAGRIDLVVAGVQVQLIAFASGDDRLQITFADATNGVSTAQFRFLLVDRPAPGRDNVVVDFNRAFLPPCAFTDHYLCPLPPAQNRLALDVSAGETFVRR